MVSRTMPFFVLNDMHFPEPRKVPEDTPSRISQMDSQLWYTDVGLILGVAAFARFSRDDVRSTRWVRAFRMPYVSVSTPP